MTFIQKGMYSLVGFTSTISATLAADYGLSKVTTDVTSKQTADVAVQALIGKAMLYLSLVAVMYGIWGGFQIVTAGGDEEKVKKGRTILIQVVIGIIVIWLAGSVVQWVVGLIG